MLADAVRAGLCAVGRDVLDAEIARILDLGVTLNLNVKVVNIVESMTMRGFDAARLEKLRSQGS